MVIEAEYGYYCKYHQVSMLFLW